MANFFESVLGLAAPFLPGPWGAVAGVASQLPGMNKSQRRADDATGQLQSIADILNSGFMGNAGQLNDALLRGSGFSTDRRTPEQKAKEKQILQIKAHEGIKNRPDPQVRRAFGISDQEIADYDAATVAQYDPSFNPYQSMLDSQYSPEAINSRAGSLFDPNTPQIAGEIASMDAGSRMAYEGAVRSAEADAARRGVLAGAGAASRINQIRAAQAQQKTAERNQLYANLGREQRGYTIGEQQTGNALMARGIDDARSRLMGTYGLLSNGVDRGVGILGGLQGMYQSDLQNRQQGIGQMLGSLSSTGTLADIFKRPTISTPPINPGGISPTVAPYNPMGAAGTVNGGLLTSIKKRY